MIVKLFFLGGNGDSYKHSVYKQLGVIETKDYSHVLKYDPR